MFAMQVFFLLYIHASYTFGMSCLLVVSKELYGVKHYYISNLKLINIGLFCSFTSDICKFEME